jgi:HK97 family phage major capsid protein
VDIPNLEECRGAGDYANVIGSIDARLLEIDRSAGGRPLDDEGRGEFAELQRVRKEAAEAKAEVEARAAYLETLAAKPENVVPPQVRDRSDLRRTPEDIYDLAAYRARTTNETQYRQTLRDGAMRALESTVFAHRNVRQDAAKEGVQRLLDHQDTPDSWLARHFLQVSSPAYRRAFRKYVTSGFMSSEEQHAWVSANSAEMRGTALAMGVTTTGGFFVPSILDPTLISTGAWTNVNMIRALARTEQIVGSNIWHGLSSGAVTATRATEAAAATEQGPTLAQPVLQPTKVQGQITFSIETGEDRPDLESEMARLIFEAKDTEEENIFTLGVGDALGALYNPVGIHATHANTTTAYEHIHTAADGTLAAADLDSTLAGLPIRFRRNSVWGASRTVIGAIQALETTGGRLFGSQAGYPAVGQPQPTPASGFTGLRLLGSPLYETPSGATSVDGANKVLAVLFDPQSYCIVDRVGMTVELIPFIFGAGQGNLVTGQRGLYFYWRNDARPLFTTGGMRLLHQA